MNRLDELKEEASQLRSAEDALYRALDAFQGICWPDGIQEPHHVEMEMEETLAEVMNRMQEIEDKVSRI